MKLWNGVENGESTSMQIKQIIAYSLDCTVFNLSRLSLFPICHTRLAYCKTEPIKLL
jgi:hypothetical protein